MALRVKEENFAEEVLGSSLPVIVDFYSDSCIPCRQMAAILGELEEEYEDRIKLVKVNVNFSTELAERYRVMAAPTILFFKEEKEYQRKIGLAKKTDLEEIIKTII